MSVLKKLAGETAIYGLSSILGKMLNFLLVPFHTRVLTMAQYGVVSYLYTISGLLMVLWVYRMETAFFRYGTDKEARSRAFDTSFLSVLASTAIGGALIVAFSSPLVAWLGYEGRPHLVVSLMLILGLDALSEIPMARLRLEGRAKRFAAIRFVNIGVNIAANVMFLWILPQYLPSFYRADWGTEYVIVANVLASASTLLMLLPDIIRKRSEGGEVSYIWQFDAALWRKMFGYAMPLLVVGLAGMVNETMSRYFLMHWLPGTQPENEVQVGVYSGCYKLAMLVSLFTQAFRYAAEPFFFAQASNKDAPDLYARVSRYFTLANAFAFVAVMMSMPLLRYFVDESYWVGLSVVPILLMANIMLGTYYNFSVWYRIKDKTAIGMWIAILGALITVVFNWMIIPKFGYYGSAWVTLGCYAFMATATWALGRRYFPVPYPLALMGGYLGLALGVYALSVVINSALGAGMWLSLAVNTLMMVLFVAGVFMFWERGLWVAIRRRLTAC